MIRLGLRLTLGSGREAALRVLVTAAAVALGVGLLLASLAGATGCTPRPAAVRGSTPRRRRHHRPRPSVSCGALHVRADLRVLLDAGWRLERVRAFDLFEMTEHLECVAVLER